MLLLAKLSHLVNGICKLSAHSVRACATNLLSRPRQTWRFCWQLCWAKTCEWGDSIQIYIYIYIYICLKTEKLYESITVWKRMSLFTLWLLSTKHHQTNSWTFTIKHGATIGNRSIGIHRQHQSASKHCLGVPGCCGFGLQRRNLSAKLLCILCFDHL